MNQKPTDQFNLIQGISHEAQIADLKAEIRNIKKAHEQRLMNENAALRNRITWLQLQLAYHGFEVVDEPAKTVTKEIPARLEVRKVRK